ncbi:MAG: hypothetical protein GX811_05995, partial [Lentisphaerae bacterium]|nr:hypothetical protein [Lentisphaerota bacterium]
MNNFSKRFLLLAYGFAGIAAQSLLFREFLTAFEGNDISVGIFFASWLFWVAFGALLIAKFAKLIRFLARHIETLLLLYIPVFALQFFAIVNAREIASIEFFTVLSASSVFFLAGIANAPFSLLTGILFPVACDWIAEHNKAGDTQGISVTNVYILEAIGSLFGGVFATLLPALGVSSITTSLLVFLVPATASAMSFRYNRLKINEPGLHRRKTTMICLI